MKKGANSAVEPDTEYSLRCWTPDGLRTIIYTDTDPQPAAGKPTLICVPGVARNHRDFRYLALKARDSFRVVSVSLLGVGASDRLSSKTQYQAGGLDLHINCIVNLLSRLGLEKVAFLGTSLGGIVGMTLAAQSPSPIAALVLNDIGAFVPKENFVGFNERLATEIKFTDLGRAETYFKIAFREVGRLSPEQWRQFTLDSLDGWSDGGYRLAFDAGIAQQYIGREVCDLELWAVWARVQCPALIVRGERSRFVRAETITEMRAMNPLCASITLADCGHFPHLRSEEHVVPILAWLRGRAELREEDQLGVGGMA
nr:alpha/beta hydrolase [Bradyrhizobium sp. 21]